MNRTYSASIKHDGYGKTTFGVYQGARFIIDCPTMKLASSVAEALSSEYTNGFEGGTVAGLTSTINDCPEPDRSGIDFIYEPRGVGPLTPPPSGTPKNESMLSRLREETDPGGVLWDDFNDNPPLTEGKTRGGTGAVKRRDSNKAIMVTSAIVVAALILVTIVLVVVGSLNSAT